MQVSHRQFCTLEGPPGFEYATNGQPGGLDTVLEAFKHRADVYLKEANLYHPYRSQVAASLKLRGHPPSTPLAMFIEPFTMNTSKPMGRGCVDSFILVLGYRPHLSVTIRPVKTIHTDSTWGQLPLTRADAITRALRDRPSSSRKLLLDCTFAVKRLKPYQGLPPTRPYEDTVVHHPTLYPYDDQRDTHDVLYMSHPE
jgi:hypothetical protein